MRSVHQSRAALLDSISERDWQATVEQYLRLGRWLWYHTWRSEHSVGGFPDLVALRAGRVVVIELKRQRGTTTPEQERWLAAWRATGWVEVYVWRPADRDEIERVLQ